MEKPATIVVSIKVEIEAPIDVTGGVLTDLPRYQPGRWRDRRSSTR